MKRIKKNWLTFPAFLLVSVLLFSFVSNNKGNRIISPDQNDSLKPKQPKIDVKVNKKYDEHGNLIQYDSSYSIIYTSPNSDIQFNTIDNDSVFAQLRDRMKMNPLFDRDDFFDGFPNTNMQNDFFNMNPMENIKHMQEMINKMFPNMNMQADSLFIQPQQNNEQKKEEKPRNMITL